MNRIAMLLLLAALPAGLLTARRGPEDESVFVRGLRPDQHESVLYVWSSDADQKDPDFLAVIDASPTSSSYGHLISTVPTSAPANEAHHFGYTVNADRIFAGGLFSNRLFIYDVATDPKHPKLLKTVPDLAASSNRNAVRFTMLPPDRWFHRSYPPGIPLQGELHPPRRRAYYHPPSHTSPP